ncbi:unnamed protein product, partial [Diamesa serratosioi]
MPIIDRKVVHSFSSEDTNFPASNLLETRITKKYKCKEVGEKLVFVVFKLVKPTQIVTIDIGNEHSAFIEVFVASSKQNTPEFKEILIASSFMTPVESRRSENPNRVRCFNKSLLIEGVCDEKWDLVKIVCTQPFARVQYGLSFITLHSPSEESDKDENGFKSKPEQKSGEKIKFGKFYLRNDSDDDAEKKDESLSAYHKWKLSKDDKNASASSVTKSTTTSSSSAKMSMKEKVQTMKDTEKRKRIVLMDDSSDEEISKPKQSRSRANLMYDEDDELPNEKMEEKMNKERESNKKTNNKDDTKKRDKTPPRTDSKNKFSSFITDETPSSKSKSSSSSSHHHKSSSSSSKDKRDTPSKSSGHSSRSESKSSTDKKSSSHSSSRSRHKDSPSKTSSTHTSRRNSNDSPEKKSSSRSKSKSTPDKRTSSSRSSIPSPSNKKVSYKPFGKLLEGVVIVFSGYQNPDRGILRQKAIDMGAKYKADWENSCTHLICAFKNTPKYGQVKGKGKIVSKSWIEKCFQEQRKISWRKYALDENDRKQSDSEDEIVDVLLKPTVTSATEETTESLAKDNDSSIEIISPVKTLIDLSSDEDMDIVDNRKPSIIAMQESIKNGSIKKERDPVNVSTDEDIDHKQDDDSFENTQSDPPLFNSKTFFLHTDLMATDIVKLEKFIPSMKGKIIKDALNADYIVSNLGRNLPKGMQGEAVKALWIYETVEMECL